MCIFQQAAFCRFEDGGDGQEQRPCTHLFFGERPADEDDEIDEPEKGNREALENRKEGRADPVWREMFFQRLIFKAIWQASRSMGLKLTVKTLIFSYRFSGILKLSIRITLCSNIYCWSGIWEFRIYIMVKHLPSLWETFPNEGIFFWSYSFWHEYWQKNEDY